MSQQTKVGRTATTIKTIDGWINIQYHSTTVVKFNDKQIVLNSGGWRTATTKTRMNQTSHQFDLGFSVYQKDFDWFVVYNGQTLEFVNGITLSRD